MKGNFEELKKWISEFFYFGVNIGLDGSKDKGWKGALFVWPFVIIVILIVFLLIRTFIRA